MLFKSFRRHFSQPATTLNRVKKSKIATSKQIIDLPDDDLTGLTNKEQRAKKLQVLRKQIKPQVLSLYRQHLKCGKKIFGKQLFNEPFSGEIFAYWVRKTFREAKIEQREKTILQTVEQQKKLSKKLQACLNEDGEWEIEDQINNQVKLLSMTVSQPTEISSRTVFFKRSQIYSKHVDKIKQYEENMKEQYLERYLQYLGPFADFKTNPHHVIIKEMLTPEQMQQFQRYQITTNSPFSKQQFGDAPDEYFYMNLRFWSKLKQLKKQKQNANIAISNHPSHMQTELREIVNSDQISAYSKLIYHIVVRYKIGEEEAAKLMEQARNEANDCPLAHEKLDHVMKLLGFKYAVVRKLRKKYADKQLIK